MTDTPESRRVTIASPEGLHIRAAALFAGLANRFHSSIHVVRGNQRVDGKSILDLLTLGAEQGVELILQAQGDDASAALDALENFIDNSFVEPPDHRKPASGQPPVGGQDV